MSARSVVSELWAPIARLEGWTAQQRAVLPFGVAAIDRILPMASQVVMGRGGILQDQFGLTLQDGESWEDRLNRQTANLAEERGEALMEQAAQRFAESRLFANFRPSESKWKTANAVWREAEVHRDHLDDIALCAHHWATIVDLDVVDLRQVEFALLGRDVEREVLHHLAVFGPANVLLIVVAHERLCRCIAYRMRDEGNSALRDHALGYVDPLLASHALQ